MMRVSWIFASGYQIDPAHDIETFKSVGPIWGSWKTWRSCGTDNVICHDVTKARELLDRNFQDQCNFYLPEKNYVTLNRPRSVHLYLGDFEKEIDDIEDIVAMHLSSAQCEIVLMVGFDLAEIDKNLNRYSKHKINNRLGLISAAVRSADLVQWVLIDHPKDLDPRFGDLANITCDSMENVLKLLIQ